MIESKVAVGIGFAGSLHRSKIVQIAVHQMRRRDARQCLEHVFGAPGMAALPLGEHLLDLLALEILLRTAQVAGNDRKLPIAGKAFEVVLRKIGERAYHHMATVIGNKLRGHGLDAPPVQQVQEKGSQDVIAMVAQGDLGGTQFAGHPVQYAASQA